MKPKLVSHESYQTFLIEQLQKHYSGGVLTLVSKDWPVISKLWVTDLSCTTTWLLSSYSDKGPAPRDLACMLRSYLLFLVTNPTIGITKWVDQLYRIPLYAILSGFEPGDVPGIGTFYDFFQRLWKREECNVKPCIKPKRQKKKKKKPKKGEKETLKNPGIVRKCPLACGTKNTCTTPCSKAKYGRTFHTFKKDNLRLFTKTSRSSEKWKLVYKRRTSVERSNKREKIDYHLEAGRHRSTKMCYLRLYAIMMCQHIDAWYSSQNETLNVQDIIFP